MPGYGRQREGQLAGRGGGSRLVPASPSSPPDYASGATLKERLIRIEAEQQPARRPVHLEMDHAMLASGKDVTHVAVERTRAKDRTRCRRIIQCGNYLLCRLMRVGHHHSILRALTR